MASCSSGAIYEWVEDDMSPMAPGTRAAGFALAVVVARPMGGISAGMIGAKPVVIVSPVGVSVLAFAVMAQPETEVPRVQPYCPWLLPWGWAPAACLLGLGSLSPAKNVGAVTGQFSAVDGLGGYFPPTATGATDNPVTNSYGIGLMLLAVTAMVALIARLTLQRKPVVSAKKPAAT